MLITARGRGYGTNDQVQAGDPKTAKPLGFHSSNRR